MLDFRILTFLELCKQHNYTKTAYVLSITQPTVTQHIQYLEQLYQVKLMQYKGRTLTLTPEGELLKNAALSFLADDKKLTKRMQEVKKIKPQIRLGATLTIGEFVLPHSLKSYLNAFPDIELSLIIGNTAYLLEQLQNGCLDCAFVEGYFDQSCFDSRLLMNDNFIAICGTNYPFANSPTCLNDLLSEPLLIRELGSGTRDILERVLHERGLFINSFSKNIIISNLNIIQYLCKQNIGITFLYKSAAKVALFKHQIIELPLKDFQIMHPYHYVTLKKGLSH